MNEKKVNANASCFVDNYNALIFIIESVVNKINTADLVKVQKVNNDNTIDVIPIIRGVNTDGEAIDQSTIYGIRYLRWQYGQNALKAVPEVGDIGLIIVCKKDISDVEKGLVGSYRKFCPSDSIYIGGIFGLNAEPTQFIEFGSNGITITSPADITINAGEVSSVSVNANSVSVNASSVLVNATSITLGSGGGEAAGVARIGDSVDLTTGKIVGGSSITKSL